MTAENTMELRGGFCDITPERAVPLAGYVTRQEPFADVHSRLEANAVVLDCGDDRVALVSFDLLYVGTDLRASIMVRLEGLLQEHQVFMAASHTHFAPATSRFLAAMGEPDQAYLDRVAERVAALLRKLLAESSTYCAPRYGSANARHSINRRRLVRQQDSPPGEPKYVAERLPNVRGPRDDAVRVLRFDAADGRLQAVVWNYACHPIGFPHRDRVSAEYAGVVRNRVRASHGNDVPVLFFQGFAGDIRPRSLLAPESLKGRLRGLLNRHYWSRFDEAGWRCWAESLGAVVCTAACSAAGTRPIAGTASSKRISESYGWLLQEQATGADRPFSLHSVSVGSSLHLVGVSAEPVAAYVPRVAALFPASYVIPVGYIDEVYGYLPTARMLSQSGYEVDGFMGPFAVPSRLTVNIEQLFMERLSRLTQSVQA